MVWGDKEGVTHAAGWEGLDGHEELFASSFTLGESVSGLAGCFLSGTTTFKANIGGVSNEFGGVIRQRFHGRFSERAQ
jgi:hypothetical protein